MTYVAAVVEVAVDAKGELTIPRVDIAVDCGATVNPDRVRAQMEGACVMGVGIATLGEITFKGGRAEQDNFDTYQVTRMTGGAARDPRAHRAGRLRQADGRRGRARRAADPARALQCDLRGDGQADPPPADTGSAQGVARHAAAQPAEKTGGPPRAISARVPSWSNRRDCAPAS